MREKLSLNQEQKLQQRLSPQQVQFVQLLEMNRAEIENEVRLETEMNPAIERDENAITANNNLDENGQEINDSAEDMQRGDYRDEDDIPFYRTNISNHSADDETQEAIVTTGTSLLDYLESQLAERNLSEKEQKIAEYIIGSLDSNGYLRRSANEISDDLIFQIGIDETLDEVNDVIQIIQDLDPPGIGAKDLRECFLIQLEKFNASESHMLAYRILDD